MKPWTLKLDPSAPRIIYFTFWKLSASQPVVTTFDYHQLLGWGPGIWNGS